MVKNRSPPPPRLLLQKQKQTAKRELIFPLSPDLVSSWVFFISIFLSSFLHNGIICYPKLCGKSTEPIWILSVTHVRRGKVPALMWILFYIFFKRGINRKREGGEKMQDLLSRITTCSNSLNNYPGCRRLKQKCSVNCHIIVTLTNDK